MLGNRISLRMPRVFNTSGDLNVQIKVGPIELSLLQKYGEKKKGSLFVKASPTGSCVEPRGSKEPQDESC